MQQFDNIVFWTYVALLLVGGLIGFFKGSKVSLITSAVAAALLILARLPGVFYPSFGRAMAEVIMAVLLIVFAIRLAKTKKFIPSGLLLVVTLAVLILLNFHHNTW